MAGDRSEAEDGLSISPHVDISANKSDRRTDRGDSPRPNKRIKVAAACDECKLRKVGCDGHQPCQRCSQDARPCIYRKREVKSALTRARMTELEERIEAYERLWNTVFEGYSLDDAYMDMTNHGVKDASDRARASMLTEGTYPWGTTKEPDQHQIETQAVLAPPHLPEPHVSGAGLSPTLPAVSFPPTRLPSTEPDLPRQHSASDGDDGDFEWQEDAHRNTDPMADHQQIGNLGIQSDAGMASLQSSGKGASYLGLSSGATFLNAIRRLSPKPVQGLTPIGALVTSGSLIMGGWSGMTQEWTSSQPGKQVVLPPSIESRPLVESYFRYFHHLTPLVHEPTIRAQLSGALPIVKPGSDVLMYMIFAMGALDLAQTEEDDDGYRYYQIARQSMDREILEGGTLPLVQGLAIMANYLQRSNRPNAGYLCLGMAIRMATALGLHIPATSKRHTPLEKEIRVRAWWSIVTLEAGCAVTFGRPHAHGPLQLAGMPLPINCDDENLTVSTTMQPVECDRPTLYTALIVQARLAKVTCGLHDRILQSHPAPSVDQVRRYDQRIVSALQHDLDSMQMRTNEPYYLARAVQMWRTRDFRAILHRPILLAAAWDTSGTKASSPGIRGCIDSCRDLALANLQDIGQYVLNQPNHERGSEWYTLYFAFRASLTLLLSIVWEPHHPAANHWKSVLTSTASWFRQIRSMKNLASSYASVLESVIGTVPSPSMIDQLIQAIGDPSASTWSETRNSSNADDSTTDQSGLDFERYWMELWGNDAATTNNVWPISGTDTQPGWQF
ncbi:hypothetical protein I302_106411 [Kwoniella bestiolae CBS 10118]|uniref:Nuclear protein n=1 Tax=Kwoniella bestiolae CBS 10118 TaxID=1296100 RepID=A0A1B9G1I4_9TREE|nr:nuclear protein [Kwoniella bestiolae CBS 10118]OCF24870.1 nuclear protein [Kwoniella bestiolae CBS 10118]